MKPWKCILQYHAPSPRDKIVTVINDPVGFFFMNVAYDEIVDFLAAGTTPQALIDFRPSETTTTKVAELIHRQKTSGLSVEKTTELNCYLQLEHIMRLAKARARLRVGAP